MQIFNDICLNSYPDKGIKITEFFRDLPWEILIYFKFFIQIIKAGFIKLIPNILKIKLKKLFSKYFL